MFAMLLKTFIFVFIACLLMPAYSLVDYTMPDDSLEKRLDNRSAHRVPGPAPVITRSQGRVSSSRSSKSGPTFLSLKTKYDSLSVKDAPSGTYGKIGVVGVETHVQTPLSLFFMGSYWEASTKDDVISQDSSYQKGNPRLLLGFNWFKFGDSSNAVQVDLYGGTSLAAQNSTLGHSRNDKIFGMQTAKRFYNVALLLSGELVTTGKVHNPDDLNIGNILQLKAALGWVVSHDIRFALEARSVKVAAAPESAVGKKLQKDFSFSSLSPSLYLNIFPAVELELGANISTKKAQLDQTTGENQNLLDTKLLEYQGCYGNSIYAGLNLSV